MPSEIPPDSKSLRPPRSKFAQRLNEFAGRLVLSEPARYGERRGRWRSLLEERIGAAFDGRIVLEIGCADGTLLAEVAARHPSVGFIGLDWKTKAIYDAACRVEATSLSNVQFIRGRAQDLRLLFEPAELEEIWVFHPDPCDGDVERPNRLMSQRFLTDAFAVLGTSGRRICLKTDHAEYFQSTLGLMSRQDASRLFEIACSSANFWADADLQAATRDRLFSGLTTGYEGRFRRKRKPIHYLELARR